MFLQLVWSQFLLLSNCKKKRHLWLKYFHNFFYKTSTAFSSVFQPYVSHGSLRRIFWSLLAPLGVKIGLMSFEFWEQVAPYCVTAFWLGTTGLLCGRFLDMRDTVSVFKITAVSSAQWILLVIYFGIFQKDVTQFHILTSTTLSLASR